MLQNLKQWQKTIVFTLFVFVGFSFMMEFETNQIMFAFLGYVVGEILYRFYNEKLFYLLYSVLAFMFVMYLISLFYDIKMVRILYGMSYSFMFRHFWEKEELEKRTKDYKIEMSYY